MVSPAIRRTLAKVAKMEAYFKPTSKLQAVDDDDLFGDGGSKAGSDQVNKLFFDWLRRASTHISAESVFFLRTWMRSYTKTIWLMTTREIVTKRLLRMMMRRRPRLVLRTLGDTFYLINLLPIRKGSDTSTSRPTRREMTMSQKTTTTMTLSKACPTPSVRSSKTF